MNIGVFFGSRSPEHDVSIVTGQLIISGLKKLGHTVIPVYIDKEGRWLIGEGLDKMQIFTQKKVGTLKGVGEYQIDLAKSQGKIVFTKKGFMGGKELVVDLAFPAFHGSYGEEGTAQGLFEMFGVPYVGCDVAASAVSMDKVLNKLVFDALGFPTPKYLSLSKQDWNINKKDHVSNITETLSFPLFIKPAHLGSSIGITKVKDKKELEFALDVALHYDSKALIEEGIEPMQDLTVCVIGNNEPIASLIQESAYSKDFFSYEDKYLNEGGAQLGNATQNLIIPANLDNDTSEAIRNMAIEIYKGVGCSGIARVDFLYNPKTKKFYTTEINPLPGTIYHHLWEKSGIKLPELLTKLIKFAMEKHEEKKKLTLSFESAILDQADSVKLQLKNK
jgi:D-alanine-D-alanine ligase